MSNRRGSDGDKGIQGGGNCEALFSQCRAEKAVLIKPCSDSRIQDF
jgi:hypothetical protein